MDWKCTCFALMKYFLSFFPRYELRYAQAFFLSMKIDSNAFYTDRFELVHVLWAEDMHMTYLTHRIRESSIMLHFTRDYIVWKGTKDLPTKENNSFWKFNFHKNLHRTITFNSVSLKNTQTEHQKCIIFKRNKKYLESSDKIKKIFLDFFLLSG